MAEKAIIESIKALRNGISYDKVNGFQMHYDVWGIFKFSMSIVSPFVIYDSIEVILHLLMRL